MKALRYLIMAIIGIIVLIAAAIIVATAILEPNDYKPQIEKAVEESTNLDLILEGDIGWSFIPLGLELNNVEAKLDGERFVSLQQLVAQIDFWSLIAMSPRVDTFVLDGLDAHLAVDKQGQGNWTRIMPEGKPKDGAETAASADATENSEPGSAEPLNFNVEEIHISNARISYSDAGTGQQLVLEDFTLAATEITLGEEFPLALGFHFETNQPQFAVDAELSARLSASEELKAFSIADLDGRFDMSGEPFGGKSVQATIAGAAKADLDKEEATVSGFSASLADLKLSTDLTVKGFGDTPQLQGKLSIAQFSLKELLDALGQAPIDTADADVLTKIAFATEIAGPAGTVALNNLKITLDDSTFQGDARYGLKNGAVGLNLQGDKINVDRYLPPPSEETAASTPAEGSTGAAATAAEEGDLLPLETLRSLILDINLGLNELVASNLTINDIKSQITAKGGVLKVNEFSGKLYDGSFGANVTLDARTDSPKWAIGSRVNSVQTLPLLKDLAEMDMLSGGANLNMDVKTTGNRVSALRSNARGEVGFNLAEGQFTRMNLTRMACQGIALANQETLGTGDWGTSTPFNDMHGTLKINGNTLNNTDLVASLAGMQLEGDGTVDMAASQLDYEVGLRIVGELHRDPACRVTEYVKNVVIPVECRGNFSEDPAGLCSFDGSRFRDTLKDIAANAAKAKAKEEVDRAKEKVEEKAKERLQEKLGEEAGGKVKDALKGLFK